MIIHKHEVTLLPVQTSFISNVTRWCLCLLQALADFHIHDVLVIEGNINYLNWLLLLHLFNLNKAGT